MSRHCVWFGTKEHGDVYELAKQAAIKESARTSKRVTTADYIRRAVIEKLGEKGSDDPTT